MPKFSKRSKDRLKTCDPFLQLIMIKAIEIYDFTILEGYRTKAIQNKHYKSRASKLKYPKSKHNKKPSQAVDIAPYPINWNDLKRFHELAGIVKTIAHIYSIKIKWGGDWKRFKDCPHFELINS